MITEPQALVLECLLQMPMSHGHDIGKKIQEVSGQRLGVATLYKTVHAMERRGFVIGEWEDQDESEYGRPRRRYYRITADGERALSAYVTHLSELRRVFNRSRRVVPQSH